MAEPDLTTYYLGRLLWADLRYVPMEHVEAHLTVTTSPFRGDPEEMYCWEVKGDRVGVPRAWGLANLMAPWDTVEDRTAWQAADWGGLTWKYGEGWRPGQYDAVKDLTEQFEGGARGLRLESPAGSGKTLMGLAVGCNLRTPTLVVVHKEDLWEQWWDTLDHFFPKVQRGHVQADKWDWEDKHVVTAMAQTLYSRRHELPPGFKERFGLVIYDEGHHYPARTFQQVLGMFPARHRLAVSATWRRGDGLDDVWNWHVGPVGHVAKTEYLTGEYVQVPWKTRLRDSWFRFGGKLSTATLLNCLVKQEDYLKWLAEQCIKGVKAGRRVLLVADRVSLLYRLWWMIPRMAPGTIAAAYCRSWLSGDGPPIEGKVPKKRATVSNSELLLAKKAPIVLATYGMMAEGTDIPTLDTLIFGTPRAEVEQVVGRIQRPEGTKKPLLIVDPVFQTPYLEALGGRRAETFDRLGFHRRT
jgi:hypothetical protein